MLSLLGSTIAATYPTVLFALPLATAGLIYLYRKKGTSRDTIVSTLFLLQKLPEQLSARRRFIPPLQFWIDLVILTLLICTVSDLRTTVTGKRIAVLIDTSLSMSAQDAQGASHIEKAKKLAAADLLTSPPTTRFTLFTAEDTLRLHSEPDGSPQQLAPLILSLTPTHTQDALPAHIKNLLAGKGYDAVWVYTDQTLEDAPIVPALKVVSVTEKGAPPPQNVWLSSIKTREENSTWQLTATIASSTTGATASTPITGVVTFQCFTSHGTLISSAAPLTQAFTLIPHAQKEVTVREISPSWEACSASLAPLSTLVNASTMDDTVWITKASAQQRIRVFSPLPVTDLKLSSLANFTVQQSGVNEHTEATQDDSPSAFYLYHRVVPAAFPSDNFAIIAAPIGSVPPGGTVSSRPTASSPQQISRWDATHPIMRYVQPQLLSFPIDRVLDCPQSSIPIISSPVGNLVCAGEEDGQRYVITAFELFPFEGKQNPALSIITLNIFQWLSQARSEYEIPHDVSTAEYILPRQVKISPKDLEAHSFKEPGILRLYRTSSDALLRAQNFIVPEESDFSRQSPLSLSLSPIPYEKKPDSSQTLSWWLGLLTLVILCADGVRRLLRRQRWRAL